MCATATAPATSGWDRVLKTPAHCDGDCTAGHKYRGVAATPLATGEVRPMGGHPWPAELPRPHAEIMAAAPPYADRSTKQQK
ncbi:hypothetical protein C2E23DRAFT_814484 [Lenzites betulinus]|nr:hypothetical protein C2E23DRAFT_814484 [Lenzites betulinus]